MSPVIASGLDRVRAARVSLKSSSHASRASADAGAKITLITPMEPRQQHSSDPIRVMTWRDFIDHRASHPEVKFCDAEGETCGRDTNGILSRHDIRITRLRYVTKESSWLSEAEELITNPADLGGKELGTGRDDIRELVLPVLQAQGVNGYKTIADALHRPRRQFAAYLKRRDLTNSLSPTLWRNRADPLIKLALRLACDDMAETMLAEWLDQSHRSQEWRSVLAAWADRAGQETDSRLTTSLERRSIFDRARARVREPAWVTGQGSWRVRKQGASAQNATQNCRAAAVPARSTSWLRG